MNKKDLKLEEWEFEFKQRNRQTILMSDIWCRALSENFKNAIRLPINNLDYLFTSSSNSYVKIKQKKKTIAALKKAITDKEYVDYLLKTTLNEINGLGKFVDKVEKIDEFNLKKIIELIKELDIVMLKIVPWFYIPWYVVEYDLLTDLIKEKLEYSKKEIEKLTHFNDALSVLCFPIKKAMFQQEQRLFYELCENYSDEKAKRYLEKYAWMKTFMFLPIKPLSFEELKERLEKAVEEGFVSQYEMQGKQKLKNQKLAEKIIKIVDDKTLELIEQARELGWVLTYGVELAIKFASKLIPFYKILTKELNVDYSQWNNLKIKEIIKILEKKLEISGEELEKRDKGYVFLMEQGEEKAIFGEKGKELADWIDANIGKVNENVKEIKGQSAMGGKIKGNVRICPTPEDSYKLEKGEILVCSMTSPDYVPAMEKAGAIVTDEGGILCHAAIISREFGTPCIIGTEIASKILKDGDLVEVDAGKGVVKIIKRAKQ